MHQLKLYKLYLQPIRINAIYAINAQLGERLLDDPDDGQLLRDQQAETQEKQEQAVAPLHQQMFYEDFADQLQPQNEEALDRHQDIRREFRKNRQESKFNTGKRNQKKEILRQAHAVHH